MLAKRSAVGGNAVLKLTAIEQLVLADFKPTHSQQVAYSESIAQPDAANGQVRQAPRLRDRFRG